MMPLNKLLSWFAAFFAMHLALRGIAAVDIMDQLSLADRWLWLRGMASDAAMALAMAFLALWLARFKAWLPRGLFVFWAVALSGNREYISEWASNLSLLDIAGLFDPTFIEGSVLTPRLFVTACAFGLVGQAAYMITQRICGTLTVARRMWPALGVLIFAVFAIPTNPPQFWMQENLVEENVRQLVGTLLPDKSSLPPAAVAEARRFMAAMHKQDLHGEMLVTPHPGVNVMMINVESLSDNILQRGWMPFLKQLAGDNLYYPQYILPNLTTIRGLYAQFCGDMTYWGRFGRDNMPGHIRKARVRCLPDILAEQGYYTVYMQGADLEFQNKRGIIPATGFSEVLGNGELPEGTRYSEWGLSDDSLFANAAQKIETIEKEYAGMPWMVSLMTVGTHHPYNVNPSFDSNLPLRERAFRYTDVALKQLYDWLKLSGRLENTLLIISGDESREGRKSATPLGGTIVRNQGLLVVVTPGKEKHIITTPFLQTDLVLSVLDFAMLDIPGSVGGRSVFREYKTFRPVAFANYAQNSLFAFWQPGELTQCRMDKWRCDLYAIGDKPLFDPSVAFAATPAASDATRALYEENNSYWIGQ